jgi:hypothetical protein
VVITTDKFIGLARLTASALGVQDLKFATIPHPLGGIAPHLAFERGRELASLIAAHLGAVTERNVD